MFSFLLLAFAVVLSFQNCSEGNLSQVNHSENRSQYQAGNGGPFEGKVMRFVNFDESGSCESSKSQFKTVIDFAADYAVVSVLNCQPQENALIVPISEIEFIGDRIAWRGELLDSLAKLIGEGIVSEDSLDVASKGDRNIQSPGLPKIHRVKVVSGKLQRKPERVRQVCAFSLRTSIPQNCVSFHSGQYSEKEILLHRLISRKSLIVRSAPCQRTVASSAVIRMTTFSGKSYLLRSGCDSRYLFATARVVADIVIGE